MYVPDSKYAATRLVYVYSVCSASRKQCCFTIIHLLLTQTPEHSITLVEEVAVFFWTTWLAWGMRPRLETVLTMALVVTTVSILKMPESYAQVHKYILGQANLIRCLSSLHEYSKKYPSFR